MCDFVPCDRIVQQKISHLNEVISVLEDTPVYIKFYRSNVAEPSLRKSISDGFGFTCTSDWMTKKCEIFKPITRHSHAKPKQMQITFDSRVKSALTTSRCFS